MALKNHSANLTSYDLVKTAALLLMVVDHIGAFFYPDMDWLRVAGRMSAPVWFFLIGYARSRDLSPPIWIGVAVLAIFNVTMGAGLLPLCILATMIAGRLLLDPVMDAVRRNPAMLYPLSFVFFVLTLATFIVLEYGSVAMLLIMAGYLTRNRDSLPFDKIQYLQFILVAAFAHSFWQIYVFFPFDGLQMLVAGFGIVAVMLALTRFRPADYPGLTARLPRTAVFLLQVTGRYTLEFYVLHQIVFRIAAMAVGVGDDALFNFHIIK